MTKKLKTRKGRKHGRVSRAARQKGAAKKKRREIGQSGTTAGAMPKVKAALLHKKIGEGYSGFLGKSVRGISFKTDTRSLLITFSDSDEAMIIHGIADVAIGDVERVPVPTPEPGMTKGGIALPPGVEE